MQNAATKSGTEQRVGITEWLLFVVRELSERYTMGVSLPTDKNALQRDAEKCIREFQWHP